MHTLPTIAELLAAFYLFFTVDLVMAASLVVVVRNKLA